MSGPLTSTMYAVSGLRVVQRASQPACRSNLALLAVCPTLLVVTSNELVFTAQLSMLRGGACCFLLAYCRVVACLLSACLACRGPVSLPYVLLSGGPGLACGGGACGSTAVSWWWCVLTAHVCMLLRHWRGGFCSIPCVQTILLIVGGRGCVHVGLLACMRSVPGWLHRLHAALRCPWAVRYSKLLSAMQTAVVLEHTNAYLQLPPYVTPSIYLAAP